MANCVDPDQTAPIGAVCSGSKLFASILNLSVMLGNYLQHTTSADNIFRCIFFLGTLRVKLTLFLQVLNADKYCNHYECEGRIEKKCLEDHCLALGGFLSDDKW